MIRGSWCSKSSLAKAAGAEVAVQQTDEKWHAAVARSTFASQNAQNTTIAEPFLKLRSGKMARRCGAKHIWKWKCSKTDGVGALFEVLMSKNCTPLWREAHLQVKMSHFLKSRWPKMARRCGAKHICKSKCAKHLRFAAFWEVSNWLAN